MINVIVPMCGVSNRFTAADYTVPKYVLDVDGVPMYAAAVNSLNLTIAHQLYFVVTVHMDAEYNLESNIKSHFPDAIVVKLLHATNGQAETLMKTRQYVHASSGTLVLCCDQMVEYNSIDYNKLLLDDSISGSLLTFDNSGDEPAWTYVRMDMMNTITDIACKVPISTTPIVGTYHWRSSDWMYRDLAELIRRKIYVNNELYICPAVLISMRNANKPWIGFPVERMISLGTPEDYEAYTHNNI
jgi:dTDP-glucose pyrophosphorylase|tara:strand:- start:3973 stop:4701 length:729 start_codon:yes stop_codon:yes gene_type:complete